MYTSETIKIRGLHKSFCKMLPTYSNRKANSLSDYIYILFYKGLIFIIYYVANKELHIA